MARSVYDTRGCELGSSKKKPEEEGLSPETKDRLAVHLVVWAVLLFIVGIAVCEHLNEIVPYFLSGKS